MSRNGKQHWSELIVPEPNSGCHLYLGYHVNTGTDMRPMWSHKLVSRLVMDAPPHLQANHKCNNPGCVNPDHLYLGSQKQNIEDQRRAGRWA